MSASSKLKALCDKSKRDRESLLKRNKKSRQKKLKSRGKFSFLLFDLCTQHVEV